MGLWNFLRGRDKNGYKRPKLGYYRHEDFPAYHGSSYLFAETALRLGHETVPRLDKLPSAEETDVLAVIAAARGMYELASELSELDAQLIAGSNKELQSVLSDAEGALWDHAGGYGDRDHVYHPSAQASVALDQELRGWAEQLPAAEQREFEALLDRRSNIRTALDNAYADLVAVRDEVTEALRKHEVISAARKLDPEAGADVQPILEANKAAEARLRVGAVNQALDAEYAAAVGGKPALEDIDDTPGPLSRPSGVSNEIELGR